MERRHIHEKIASLTETISVNNNRLFLHDEKIAQLEIDVLRKNAIELYEQINMLHLSNLRIKGDAQLTLEKSDSIALGETVEFIAEEPEPVKETVTKEPTVQADTPIAETVEPESPVEEKYEEPEIKVVPIPEIKQPTHPEKAEPPKMEENTLIFEIKTEPDSTKKVDASDKKHLFEKYRTSKLESIKKAISVLKRYEYQNQLFNGDPKIYTQNIDILDQAASAEVALSLLENSWPEMYKWDEKDEPLIEELKELVYRRFS